MFYEDLYLYQQTGVNTARTQYSSGWIGKYNFQLSCPCQGSRYGPPFEASIKVFVCFICRVYDVSPEGSIVTEEVYSFLHGSSFLFSNSFFSL
jgi:hypothetical protein